MRRLLTILILALALYVFLPRVTSTSGTVHALARMQWSWAALVGAASLLTYCLAAVAITAAAGRRLPFGRTVVAQLAGAFTNRLAPAGLGAMATQVRYLRSQGLSRSEAVGSVAVNAAAGFVVHLLATTAAIAAAGASHTRFSVHPPDVPDRWEVLVYLTLGMGVLGIVLGAIWLRGRWVGFARETLCHMAALAQTPRRAARLLGASAGITAGYALALVAAVNAAGGGPSLVSVVAVYLGGSAVAAAAPTPGGLGALEAGLIAGLTSVGLAPVAAVTSVVAFRLITYWLPVLPGAAAFWILRRAGDL
jgi:undecaprenyl-diphosphatase